LLGFNAVSSSLGSELLLLAGQQHGAKPAGGAAAFDVATLRQKLQQLVGENRLQSFYPLQRIDQLAQFVAGRDVAGLGDRWSLPREVQPTLPLTSDCLSYSHLAILRIPFLENEEYPTWRIVSSSTPAPLCVAEDPSGVACRGIISSLAQRFPGVGQIRVVQEWLVLL